MDWLLSGIKFAGGGILVVSRLASIVDRSIGWGFGTVFGPLSIGKCAVEVVAAVRLDALLSDAGVTEG